MAVVKTDLRVTLKVEVSSGVSSRSHVSRAMPFSPPPVLIRISLSLLFFLILPSCGSCARPPSLREACCPVPIHYMSGLSGKPGTKEGEEGAPERRPSLLVRRQVCLSLWQEGWLEHVLVSSGTRVLFLALRGGSQLCHSRSRGSDALF